MQLRRPKLHRLRKLPTAPPQQPKPPRTIVLREEFITLGQLLKVAGVIGSGGEAKAYLADTVVRVNGEPEQRRGRKLRPGDLIVPPGEGPILLEAGTDAGVSGEPN